MIRKCSIVGLTAGLLAALGTLVTAADAPRSFAAAPGTISIGDVAIIEGDVGNPLARVTITLSSPLAVDVGVGYTIAAVPPDGAAAADAGDFVPRVARARIRAGKVAATVVVKTIADAIDEPDEAIAITVTSVEGASIGDGTGTVTIRDDDMSVANRIAIGDAALVEGDVGRPVLRFPITLDRPQPIDVTVSFAAVAVTATAGSDYVARTGRVRVRAGRVAGVINVATLADQVDEVHETLRIELAQPVGAALTGAVGIGTIIDDDAPVVTIPTAPMSFTAIAGPGNGALTATWDPPSSDGGAAVTHYELEVDRPGGIVIGTYTGEGATVVCGAPGVTCTLRVRAVNSVGPGPWSGAISETTFQAPGPVGNLTTSGSHGSIVAVWDVPTDEGDFPILGYRVERSFDGADFDFVGEVSVRTTSVSCPGEAATCWLRIRARNAAGVGPTVEGSATTWARPGAPTLETIRRIGDLVGLGWRPPASDGGTAIFDYRGERSTDGGATWVPVGSVMFTTPTCPIGTACMFRVQAANAVGAGPPSNVLTVGP